MATFDINNPPSQPDSTLDSDLTNVQNFVVQDSSTIPIAAGDWVDVDPSALSADINWGYSYQVCNLYPSEYPASAAVGVLYSADGGNTYSETQVSGSWLQNNFRRVPNV